VRRLRLRSDSKGGDGRPLYNPNIFGITDSRVPWRPFKQTLIKLKLDIPLQMFRNIHYGRVCLTITFETGFVWGHLTL